MPLLVDNLEIKEAFLKNLDNKMTSKQFDLMVSENNGPTIYLTDGDSKFDPNYPDRIYMNMDLVNNAQNALNQAKSVGNVTYNLIFTLFNLNMSILDEASHNKAQQYGVPDINQSTMMADYERGFSFEDLAFGRMAFRRVHRYTGQEVRDDDKVKDETLKMYREGNTKKFGLTISGQYNNVRDRLVLGIKKVKQAINNHNLKEND